MTYLWAFLAAATAVALETMFRKTDRSWFALLPYLALPALFINYAICQIMRGTESLIAGLLVFSLANVVMRAAVGVVYLKERPTPGMLAAIILMILARVLVKIWR